MPVGIMLIAVAIIGLAVAYTLDKDLEDRERRDAKPDLTCKQCGYNLTLNTSGVCPECGSAIKGREKRRCDGEKWDENGR